MSNVPLPEPLGFYFPPRAYQDTPSTEMVGLFSDDQMHTFAAAVSAADNAALRERVRVLEDALSLAYGHLWLVNDEPGTPIRLHSSGTAASIARKILGDLIAAEQRESGIYAARAALEQKP